MKCSRLPGKISAMTVIVPPVIVPIMAVSTPPAPCFFQKAYLFGKHSAVIAAFRQYFIKTGEFDARWSKTYELIMTSRQIGDYELNLSIEKEQAEQMVLEAGNFIQEVEAWLNTRRLL